jgi:hypothetical protein
VTPKLAYLTRLGAQLLEDPSPAAVKALLRRAQAAGCCPANLYLSALRLWPRDLPLPPDPRLLFPLEDEAAEPSLTPEPPPGPLAADGLTDEGSHSRPRRNLAVTDADYPLGSLGLQIQDHWKEHRPTMYRDLEQSGTLRESVYAAQELTLEALYDLEVKKKVPHDQAWEAVKEGWAFLPTEEDVPELGVDQTQFRALLPGNTGRTTEL